jgi:hypothetical protein
MTTAHSLFQQITQSGVTLRVDDDGTLRASGGNFSPELRKLAGEMKEELKQLVINKRERLRDLNAAERQWIDFATKEKGFFVRELQDGVSRILYDRYMETRWAYVAEMVTLRDVYEAFSDYAKSTRRNYFVFQLEGEVYKPGREGRNSQRDIHRAFRDGKLTRVRMQTTTPQIEPTGDQLARMERYFGIDAKEYALGRKLGR